MAETWFTLAAAARRAASELVHDHPRGCVNRAYYAAYSKITFDLARQPGVAFPAGDEGPRHPGRTGTGGIRRLIEAHMMQMDAPKRQKLSELIGRLYTLRCVADYRPSMDLDARDAREAISIMNTVFDSFSAN
jgi:hypothetical protein